MKTYVFLLLVLLHVPMTLFAGVLGLAREDGGQAGAFLSFGAGARALGMGKTFVGVADDASASYWNPAGLVQLDRREMNALYASLYENTGYSFAGYAHPASFGTFGIALVNLNSSGFQLRDEFNFEQGEAGLNEAAALVSFGRTVWQGKGSLSAGITAKAVNQSINAVSDTGFGADLGVFWDGWGTGSLTSPLCAGLSLQNVVAPALQLAHNADTYPFAATLGFGYYLFDEALLLALDVNQTEGRQMKLHFGSEYRLKNILAFRAGLDETELTTGIGITWRDYSLDYAFAYHDAWDAYDNLGISHRLGLRLAFDAN